jgi:hypothetical protein
LLIGTWPSREVTIFSEECGSPATALLPDALLLRVSSATVLLEHVIVRNPPKLKHDEPMEAEPFASKDTLPIEERRGNALLDSIATKARESRKEGSTDNRVIIDTPMTTGSAISQTLEEMVRLVGEPLSQLGDNWLGKPFVALASLIPTSSMADVSELPSKEATKNIIYHFLDVSVLIFCFDHLSVSKDSRMFL